MKRILLSAMFAFAVPASTEDLLVPPQPPWVSMATASPEAPKPPAVREATLENGMRVLVLERRQSPTIAFNVHFRVGSVNDIPGKTGLAHLFEHMIFKGTKTINTKNYSAERKFLKKIEETAQELILEGAKQKPDLAKVKVLETRVQELEKEADRHVMHDEYEKIYTQHGGAGLNAFTAWDMTGYLVSLPANKLDLWLTVEADRFKNPVLREFYRERQVVMEERRMRTESSPDGALWEAFVATAFHAHPYREPPVGWMSDLQRLTRTDAELFFQKHYGPNNAVVGIVGDVDASAVLAALEKRFGGIPTRPTPPELLTREPEQKGERRVTVRFEAQPQLELGFKKPDAFHPDDPVYDAITRILSNGRTSRFYRELVEKRKLAVHVASYFEYPGQKYPGLFIIDGVPRHPATLEQLEEGIHEVLEGLAKDGPKDWELEKMRNQYEAELVREMQSNEGMADKLAYNEAILGSWRRPWESVESLRKVTAADVRRVASELFQKDRRTAAYLLPPEKAPSATDAPQGGGR